MKTDLDILPVYHQSNESRMAHFHLYILAYMIISIMCHQFKANVTNNQRKEILGISNTQKVVTTTWQNTFDKMISFTRCSEPTGQLKQVLDILKAKTQSFRK